MNQKRKEVKPVSEKEMANIREALVARFAASLEPGESLISNAIRDAEHSILSLIVQSNDNRFRLEMEAVALAENNEEMSPKDRLFHALDFIAEQLHNFFADRMLRFHDDWRIYTFKGSELRFRAAQTNPELETLAEQWLEKGD